MLGILQDQSSAPRPHVSATWLRLFSAYNHSYVRRHFHRIRILKTGRPRIFTQPTVVYLNHASWWDPLVCLFLSRQFFDDRDSFAPIDAAMMERYRFFKNLGFFGVEQHTVRGAVTFLRAGRALLSSSRNMLWLTPQGRFADVRERPLQLQTGLAALATRLSGVAFLPLAIEYPFWTESRPEILLSFGRPLMTDGQSYRDADEWSRLLSEALENTQEELAMCSCRRDPRDWLTISRGRSGGNRVYDTLRRLRAWLGGRKFVGEHQPESVR